jgi:hypothetical protein
MATNYNINCIQGDYLQLTLNVKNASGDAINLNGYEIRGDVKSAYGTTGIFLDLNPIITNATSGIVSINVSSAETALLPVNEYVYDIERYPSGIPTGNSIKLLKGKFIIYPEVTTF